MWSTVYNLHDAHRQAVVDEKSLWLNDSDKNHTPPQSRKPSCDKVVAATLGLTTYLALKKASLLKVTIFKQACQEL